MGFYDINNNRVLCVHTTFMGWLTILGFCLASFHENLEKDIYLMVGLGAMILFILSLYQLRTAYSQYYDYMVVSQHDHFRAPKVRFEEEEYEEEIHHGAMHV